MHEWSGEMHDQLSIATPELVSLEFSLAGFGSRALALLADYLLQGIAALLLLFLLVLILPGLGRHTHIARDWAAALFLLLPFLLQWGYFTLFEAFWNGQTPGKRMLSLQVIQQTGRPLGFLESLARNLVRFVDLLPGCYAVGAISLFATRRQQRLGDLVAGSLVIHARPIETLLWHGNGGRTITAPSREYVPAQAAPRSTGLPADALARLDRNDLAMIESLIARRLDLPMAAGDALAARVARQVCDKMGEPVPVEMSPGTFLETLAAEMRSTSVRR